MTSRRLVPSAPLVVALALWTSLAFAQANEPIQPGTSIVVTTAAPVFLMPDSTRTPLRTLPVGTTAVADRAQGGWVRITFTDPQYGPRTGWIELRFVKVGAAPEQPSPARPRQVPDVGGTTRTQPGTQPARPARPRSSTPTIRVFATGAVDWMEASQSFDAVTGSDRVPAFGGGVQGADLWRGLFVEFAAEYSSLDGERVFVFNDEVFSLGIPVEITMLPLDLVGGWRVPVGRVAPFAGGGVTFMKYEETSDFSENDENVREWFPGFVALAGVEARIVNNLHARVDVRYRRLNDALGEGGVSALFGERALGGTGVSFKIVFGR